MDGQNTGQIEYWNGPAGQRWAAKHERMDKSLARVTEALLQAAAPLPGERVLDIGCGVGTTTLEIARRTGARVLGIDVSAPMLAVARARAAEHPDIELVEADAATHDFQKEFELAFSRFGVMFFADPVAAFSNLHRALVPGGRIAFACFRALSENAWARVPLDAARDFVQAKPADPNAPGPFAFAGSGRVRDILARAGFREIRVERHDTEMFMGADLVEASERALESGPLSRLIGDVDRDTREQIMERVARALAPFARTNSIDVGMAVWLVHARS
ncbi:MAG: class I SAM-dependent methyltransferase [Acidobacteriota bacterium]